VGIDSAAARKLIKQLQPYNAQDALDDPLTILHNLDRTDKHQTLVLVQSKWNMKLSIPLSLFTWTIIGRPDIDRKLLTDARKRKLTAEFSLYVAFPQFGRRENLPVVSSLMQLSDAVAEAIRQFSEL
jgi:hypothetical protein